MTPDPDRPPGADGPAEGDADFVPVESEDAETPAAPRRTASAEFVVESTPGAQAMLREAMDPANQSLREALRLSFRVLQFVILVLIVLFVFSGVQTVDEGQSGVLLRWGKILPVDGKEALEPGLKFSRWPYPAGEFVLFADQNRRVDLGNRFWPGLKGQTLEAAIKGATVHQQLRPGRDGSVLARGGDIAHLKVAGQYQIDEPSRFVHAVEDQNDDPRRLDADRLVELSLERAAVHVAATRTLQEIVPLGQQESAASLEADLKKTAQAMLNDVASGVRLTRVDTPLDPMPPLAIKKAFGELQESEVIAQEMVENARQDQRTTLLSVAGQVWEELNGLIEAYELAYAQGRIEESEKLLEDINTVLESSRTSGEVAAIVQYARSYGSLVERTLGREASRFESVLEAYRDNPEFVVQRLWLDTYGRVLSRSRSQDIEIITLPSGGGSIRIALAGLDHVREERRQNMLRQREFESAVGGLDLENPYIRRAGDIREGPGRQLNQQGGARGRR